MGLFSPRWYEVFFSTNPEQFFRGQNVSGEHGPPFRTKTENRAFRGSRNNLGGRTPMLIRMRFGLESGDEYRIFVAEENTAAVRLLLQSNGRTGGQIQGKQARSRKMDPASGLYRGGRIIFGSFPRLLEPDS